MGRHPSKGNKTYENAPSNKHIRSGSYSKNSQKSLKKTGTHSKNHSIDINNDMINTP